MFYIRCPATQDDNEALSISGVTTQYDQSPSQRLPSRDTSAVIDGFATLLLFRYAPLRGVSFASIYDACLWYAAHYSLDFAIPLARGSFTAVVKALVWYGRADAFDSLCWGAFRWAVLAPPKMIGEISGSESNFAHWLPSYWYYWHMIASIDVNTFMLECGRLCRFDGARISLIFRSAFHARIRLILHYSYVA